MSVAVDVSEARLSAPAPVPADEGLVEEARNRLANRPSARDLGTTAVLAGGFLAAAFTVAATLPAHRTPSLLVIALLVGTYATLSRIELEVGPGSAVPTQLVFVPMLFALPLSLVPLCVAAGYVLGAVPDYLGRRMHPTRFLVLVAGSWYAIGPAVVLALFSSGTPTWRDAHVYVAALVAQFGLDFVGSSTRERIAFGHGLRALLPSFAWVYAVDSFLAPIGLGAAVVGVAGLLVVIPLAGLLALLARDRRERIDRVVA